MSSLSCRSTPVYLDPKMGPHCGSCALCNLDNPYNPAGFGLCESSQKIVNIRRKTECKNYLPRT